MIVSCFRISPHSEEPNNTGSQDILRPVLSPGPGCSKCRERKKWLQGGRVQWDLQISEQYSEATGQCQGSTEALLLTACAKASCHGR